MNIYISYSLSDYFFNPLKLKKRLSLRDHPYIRTKIRELEIEYGRCLIISLQTIYQNAENPLNCHMWLEDDHKCNYNILRNNCDYEDPELILYDFTYLIEITRYMWQTPQFDGYIQNAYGKMDGYMREKLRHDLERIHPELWVSFFVISGTKYI